MTILRRKREFIVLNTQIQLYKGVYSSHQKDLLLFSDVQLHLIYIFREMENKNCLWTHFKQTSNFVFPMKINKVPFMEYVVHTDQAQIYSAHSRAETTIACNCPFKAFTRSGVTDPLHFEADPDPQIRTLEYGYGHQKPTKCQKISFFC